MGDVNLGQYAIPVIITVVLGLIFKYFDNPDGTSNFDRWKPLIAVLIGIILGVVAMFYNCGTCNFKLLVDYILYGFMQGAAAVGIWEVGRSTVNRPK